MRDSAPAELTPSGGVSDPADLAERLQSFLSRKMPVAEAVTVQDVRRTFGGNARRAWSFEASWVEAGKRRNMPCIILSQIGGGREVGADIVAEYNVLAAMTGKGIRAPAALGLDEHGMVTGAPAIILERIDGDASAVKFLDHRQAIASTEMTRELAEITADLHQFDWRSAGLSAPARNAHNALISEWEAKYHRDRLEPYPPLSYLFLWLKENAPAPTIDRLIHGDLRPGNFLFAKGRITALLDWEMAHIGDPAEDIAWIYRPLWSPAKFLPLEEFVTIYEARGGEVIDRRRLIFYRIFSDVKFATLSLGAHAAFTRGTDKNFRYADRAAKVPECVRRCFAWIKEYNWSCNNAAG